MTFGALFGADVCGSVIATGSAHPSGGSSQATFSGGLATTLPRLTALASVAAMPFSARMASRQPVHAAALVGASLSHSPVVKIDKNRGGQGSSVCSGLETTPCFYTGDILSLAHLTGRGKRGDRLKSSTRANVRRRPSAACLAAARAAALETPCAGAARARPLTCPRRRSAACSGWRPPPACA